VPLNAATDDVPTPEFSSEPSWADGLSPFVPPTREFDRRVDVAIVGPGDASRPRSPSRAGREVAVFEAKRVRMGASVALPLAMHVYTLCDRLFR
jgi:hypothetical protein